MLTSAIVPAINHLLRQANFARQKLRAHQDKIARVEIAPFVFTFAVLENGEVAAASPDASRDVVLTLTLPLLFRILTRDETATRDVTIAGDGEFAADINFIAANLSYDAEEDLSRVVGDVAAHRIAGAGRDFVAWQKSLFSNFAAAGAEFFTFEQPLLANPKRVREFMAEVDELRDAVARLEKRLEKLTVVE